MKKLTKPNDVTLLRRLAPQALSTMSGHSNLPVARVQSELDIHGVAPEQELHA